MNSSGDQGAVVSSRRILYTPSGFAKANLTHLQEIGELKALQPHVSRRENLASCLFFQVVSGSGTLYYQGQEHPLVAGDCVFIDCGGGYAHATGDDLWTLRWVHFYGPSLPGVYQKYVERGGGAVFRPAAGESFTRVWEKLYNVADSLDYIRDMRINELLTSLLTLLMEQSWHPEAAVPTGRRQTLHRVRAYLEEHCAEKISLDALAEMFYMNKYYLVHMFREQFGCTVLEYLTGLRITKAKQLLRFTDLTTEAIAAACGLGDANYFSRVFRRAEGVPPTQYRRYWRT